MQQHAFVGGREIKLSLTCQLFYSVKILSERFLGEPLFSNVILMKPFFTVFGFVFGNPSTHRRAFFEVQSQTKESSANTFRSGLGFGCIFESTSVRALVIAMLHLLHMNPMGTDRSETDTQGSRERHCTVF